MILIFLGLACEAGKNKLAPDENTAILDDVLTNNYDDGLVPLEDIETHPLVKEHFSWYAQLLSPSGQPVMILAQANVTRTQIIRLRSVLEFYLTPRDLSDLSDIDLVFDAMGENRSTLLFFDDESSRQAGLDDGLLDLDWQAFSIVGADNILEGTEGWLQMAPPGKAFSICYDMIFMSGVKDAQPNLAEQVESLSDDALASGLWEPDVNMLEQWSSMEQASGFISQLIGIDYGFWAHSTAPWDGAWSVSSRLDIENQAPDAAVQIRSLFPEYIDMLIQMDPSLETSITLNYSEDLPWTSKSQYFVNVAFDGESDIDLSGNSLDNFLSGNAGSNRIIGGDGVDTVSFQGPRTEYDVQQTANGYLLFDEDIERDGADEIIEVEWVEFADELVSTEDLFSR